MSNTEKIFFENNPVFHILKTYINMLFLLQNNSNSNTGEKVQDVANKATENASYIYTIARNSVNELLTQVIERFPYIIAGIIVILVFWLISKLVKTIFLSASKRTHLDNRLRTLFSRLISVAVFVLGLFAALTVIIPGLTFGSLIAGLGFTSFIVGFATKDILNNLLSGVLILWNQPFHIGDYLFVKGNEGTVEYIGVRATKLRKDDGELVLIPNGEMYTNALVIRGAGAARRFILKIFVDLEAKVSAAKEIISDTLTKIDGVENEPVPGIYVRDLTTDGVNLSVYFWINTDKNSPLKVFDEAATRIKEALQESRVVIFPPSSVIISRAEEIK